MPIRHQVIIKINDYSALCNALDFMYFTATFQKMIVLSQFRFIGFFFLLSTTFLLSDSYKIVYMTQWLCCCGMCNMSLPSAHECNYSKMKFSSNMNNHGTIISEMGVHQTSINSLWPNDITWQHRSRSTLAQVMAYCLMAPSHYLNQCWLVISKVQ